MISSHHGHARSKRLPNVVESLSRERVPEVADVGYSGHGKYVGVDAQLILAGNDCSELAEFCSADMLRWEKNDNERPDSFAAKDDSQGREQATDYVARAPAGRRRFRPSHPVESTGIVPFAEMDDTAELDNGVIQQRLLASSEMATKPASSEAMVSETQTQHMITPTATTNGKCDAPMPCMCWTV